MNILITSIGSNTGIGVAKSLKSFGFNLYGCDINPSIECSGISFIDRFFQVPLATSESYNEVIIKLIKEYDIQCVIPIHDVELMKISDLAMKFPELAKWAVPSYNVVQICNNKLAINKKLEHLVNVPTMFNSMEEIEFPAIKKPNGGVSSRGMSVFTSGDSVKYETSFESGYIYQKYVRGVEYTVDCYSSYKKDDFFVCSIRERIETKAGLSVKGKIIDHEQLATYCKLIHKTLNYKGVSNIQFIISENEKIPYFIEINPRFAGGGVLTYLNGLNLPLYTVSELMDLEKYFPVVSKRSRLNTSMVRYFQETFIDEQGNII